MGTFQIDFGNAESGGGKQPRIIGIDLGTTNSLGAYLDLTGPRIIPTANGGAIVPSVVAVTKAGAVIAGDDARDVLLTDPHRAVYSAKRLMGRGVEEIREELKLFPFRIVKDLEPVVRIQLGKKKLTPPEVSAAILREIKKNAEAHFGEPVTQAVITVPAYFNDAQRQATKDAGRIAGLEVLRLVNEPTAASLAYGLDKRREGIIAVYDFGGGTFDVSILKLHDGIFEVLSTNGDTHLGGDDIDQLMLRIALEDINSEWGDDLSDIPMAVEKLRRAVIAAKEKLSFVPEVSIEFDFENKHYRRALNREMFDQLIAPIVERTLAPCRACLKDASLTPEQIDEVVMVGGSTRIPLVRTAVERLFKSRPHTELNPDEVVALGAAVQAGILGGEVDNALLLDVTPLSLGIETMGGLMNVLIHRNSTIPASATETFTTGVDGQTNVLIHVLQGERELVKDCRSLARFDLKGIDPTPAGYPKIEVRFLIDANGILNVAAKDVRSGKEQSVEIKPSYGLTDEQVEAMIEESVAQADNDIKERQVREARIEADRVLPAVEKAKREDVFFELAEDKQQAITRAQNELLMVYHSDDHLLIREKIEQLDRVTHELAENMMNAAVSGALKGTKL